MSAVQEAIRRVQDAADADAKGDPVAHKNLLEEIHKLRLAAEKPPETTMRMRFQMLENLCIRVAIEYGVLQAIAAKKGKPVTAAELSKETGADELFITRTMRLITYVGIVSEVDYATYASNERTVHITQKGFIAGEKHHTDLSFGAGSKIVDLIRTRGLAQFPEEEVGGKLTPFVYAFGKPIFEWMQEDQEHKQAFDDYMTARRDPNAPQWFQIYPVSERLKGVDKDTVVVVDIGGGAGHEISKFRKTYPDTPGRFILEDLPETFEKASSKPEGVEMVEYDFFNEQPIKGARIYYMRAILHDWSPKNCNLILQNIVKAMDPEHSRILIDDYVLPDTGAERRAAGMDWLMMLIAGGMERTKRQFEEMLDAVGLELVQIWSAKTGNESIVEARLKR